MAMQFWAEQLVDLITLSLRRPLPISQLECLKEQKELSSTSKDSLK